MPRAHDPHTPEGREGLARVIAYERGRHRGWVRATVAERLLRALRDQHARPALCDPALAHDLDMIAHYVFNGNVAGVAIKMAELVERARRAGPAGRQYRSRKIVDVELPK